MNFFKKKELTQKNNIRIDSGNESANNTYLNNGNVYQTENACYVTVNMFSEKESIDRQKKWEKKEICNSDIGEPRRVRNGRTIRGASYEYIN